MNVALFHVCEKLEVLKFMESERGGNKSNHNFHVHVHADDIIWFTNDVSTTLFMLSMPMTLSQIYWK